MLSTMLEIDLAPDWIRPLSRKEYDRMVEIGILDEDEHVELLAGMLVKVSPHGAPHARVVEFLNSELIRRLYPRYRVLCQLPLAASEWSEPEPDIAVYFRTEPQARDHPNDPLLVVEVSDSTLRRDRSMKLAIYAAAGVPEYWIVNVTNMTVEVYTEPTPEGYANKRVLRDGDVLQPHRVPELEIAVADLPRP